MTFRELIDQKSHAFEEIPDKFLSATEKAQKQIFSEMLALLDKIKKDAAGNILQTDKNLQIVSQIAADLKLVILDSDFKTAVDDFAQEFDKLKGLNKKYFDSAFKDATLSDFTDAVMAKAKRTVVTDLLDSSLNAEFLHPIESLLSDAVSSGAGFQDTLKEIRNFIEGGKNSFGDEVEGKILRYAKTIAHDSIAVADASYTNAVADELEIEWYMWDGPELAASRCFCLERKGKFFHYKEIESWGRGENVGECNYPWDGWREGTNESTIFQYRGGWGCQDSVMPVSIVVVPRDVIERNIENGNFVPSQFEKEELSL